jgi:DNA-binding MarR family transcriptional regulator
MELMLTEHRGQLQWQFSEKRRIDPSLEFLRLIWERKPAMQKELAKEKGLTDGRISQLCGKLRRKKLLEPSPSLQITPEGKEALIAVFPELEAVMLSQGELAFRDVV